MAWKPTNTYLRICFTANVPKDKTWEDFDVETLRTRLNPSFLICGNETAKTGQKHFQGYAEFPKRKLGSAIMSAFERWGIKAHLEAARGTAQENVDYCEGNSKDKTPNEVVFRFGEASQNGQGSRSDLAAMVGLIKEGKTDQELLEENPGAFLVHHRAFQVVRSILAPKREWPSKLIFIWGATGLGKTRESMRLEPQKLGYRDPFMIGYNGQNPVVLFDDFKHSKMDPKYWLELCDRYPMTVENKGTTVNWAPKVIIFTSNDDPELWWLDAADETRAAIRRRMEEFGEIIHLTTGVPEGQQLLKAYFTAPKAAAPSSSATGGGGASVATEVIDLSQDSEDDSEGHGQPKLRSVKRQRIRDWDEHSDASNMGYADDHDAWDDYHQQFAPGCKHTAGCSTRTCLCEH